MRTAIEQYYPSGLLATEILGKWKMNEDHCHCI